MKCRCSNCGWLEVNPSGAMFCGYSDERTWENESCLAWKDKDAPKTNADKIRAMSDGELGRWLERIRLYCSTDSCGRNCPLAEVCYSSAEGPKETLDWLQQEAE